MRKRLRKEAYLGADLVILVHGQTRASINDVITKPRTTAQQHESMSYNHKQRLDFLGIRNQLNIVAVLWKILDAGSDWDQSGQSLQNEKHRRYQNITLKLSAILSTSVN